MIGLTLVAFALIAALRACHATSETQHPEMAGEASPNPKTLTLFYFHGRQRCATCVRMERMVREVASGFPLLEVKAVNLDAPANGHYVADFGLTMRTVVLSFGTRFAVLDRCWALAHDETAFKAYVSKGIADFIAERE